MIWRGVDHRSDSWGRYARWDGNSAETPWSSFDLPAGRIDARVQAGGEVSDFDYSALPAWLTFRLIPPTWGRLEIHTGLWMHGFHQMHSNDKWWNRRHANRTMWTWIEVVQDFTRDKHGEMILDREIKNGSVSGRIDRRSWLT